jgi:hypothetical protein
MSRAGAGVDDPDAVARGDAPGGSRWAWGRVPRTAIGTDAAEDMDMGMAIGVATARGTCVGASTDLLSLAAPAKRATATTVPETGRSG